MYSEVVDGKHLVFGLEWSRLSSDNYKKEAKRLAIEQDMAFGVRRTIELPDGEREVIGLVDSIPHTPAFSAAAILADQRTNFLHIEKLENNRFWICVGVNKEVLPGGDKIVSKGDLPSAVSSLYQMVSGSDIIGTACPKTHSDIDEAFLSQCSPFSIRRDIDLDDKDVVCNQHKIYNLKVNKKAPLLVLLGAGAMIGTYFTVVVQPTMSQLPSEATMSAPQAIVDTIKLANPIKQKPAVDPLKIAREEEIAELLSQFSQHNTQQEYKQIYSYLSSVPRTLFGWSLNSFSYNISEPRQLRVLWARNVISKATVFRTGLRAASIKPKFTLDGKFATSTELTDTTIPLDYGEITDFIKNKKYTHVDFMDNMNNTGVRWSLNRELVSERDTPIKGIRNAELAKKKQVPYYTVSLAASGNGLFKLRHTVEAAIKDRTFLIKTIKVDYKTLNWSVTGTMYEL